ncbi:MAG: VWA domain-containing protein [Spirochaetales bacterium]|jgi:hypothetical protein|nr:VWA domain-containing protein [Spirochaetales bacterium]
MKKDVFAVFGAFFIFAACTGFWGFLGGLKGHLFAQDFSGPPETSLRPGLSITSADIRIDVDTMSGYHLKIRKKPGMQSVMLTESTEDPARRSASFAYKTSLYNTINGNERRLLNGEELKRSGEYFLIDSTPESDPLFGEAFHIFIPYILDYGYPWSRQGEVMAVDGAYMSIRAFGKPFADYTGGFQDNPFVLRIVQQPLEGPREENFLPAAIDSFSQIAAGGAGRLVKSRGQEDMLAKIMDIVDSQRGPTLDLVLALDTTRSMHDDLPYLKEQFVPLLAKKLTRFTSYRIGIIVYRDYNEEYLTRPAAFTNDLNQIQNTLDSAKAAGGGDTPEAVHEALYTGITHYGWSAASRLIILIGDAPAHPRPRGKITLDMVRAGAAEKKISLYMLILPH